MIQITDKAEYYKQIKSTIPVNADFTAAWCASCKMQKHILAEFENGLKGKIKIITIDVDENAELADELGVKVIPSQFVYDKGVLADKTAGLSTKAALSEKVIYYI